MNTEKQVATLPCPSAATKFSGAHRKERNGFMQEYAAIVIPGPEDYRAKYRRAHAVVTLRIYGTDARNYACIWTSGEAPEHSRNGSGSAGGYGYHRPSAAAQEAINNAGFVLSQRIDGVGDSAIESAVLAVAAAIGFPDAVIHIAHA